jgi:hypothetical protein
MVFLPPGAQAGVPTFPTELAGTWTGEAGNWLPLGFQFGSIFQPYTVNMQFDAPASSSDSDVTEWDLTWSKAGTVTYPTFGTQAPLKHLYPVECTGQVAGANPSYDCFQFVEDNIDEEAIGNAMPPFDFQAITISMQTDGRMYWSYHQGVMVTAVAYLTKAADPNLDVWAKTDSSLSSVCNSKQTAACLGAFYASECKELPATDGFACDDEAVFSVKESRHCIDWTQCPAGMHLPGREGSKLDHRALMEAGTTVVARLQQQPVAPLQEGLPVPISTHAASSIETLCESEKALSCTKGYVDTNCFELPSEEDTGYDCATGTEWLQCADTALCQPLPNFSVIPGSNYSLGRDTDPAAYFTYPTSDLKGIATVHVPAAPYNYFFSDLSPTFEVRQRNLARTGCTTFSAGIQDLSFQDELNCGIADYGVNTFWAVFNWLDPLVCYEALQGPNPTGRCIFSYEYVPKLPYTLENVMAFRGVEAHFMAYSEQTDGSIYWSSTIGTVVHASGVIAAEDEVALATKTVANTGSEGGFSGSAVAGVAIGAMVVGVVGGAVLSAYRRESPKGERGVPLLV